MPKNFKIPADQMRRLVPDEGSCLASDRITVGGEQVGWMYREQPDRPHDSGWRFFAGDEDEAYQTNPANFEIYSLNTIANYDPDIIPLLPLSVGAAFQRHARSGKLVRVHDWAPPLG